MDTDDLLAEIEEIHSSQQQTQSTQPASQQSEDETDHLWGYLESLGGPLKRTEFLKTQHNYNIGRDARSNNLPLLGPKIRFYFRQTACPPPTILDANYDFLNKLGDGSFGVVVKALHRRSGKFVAVKMIKDARSIGGQNPSPRKDHFIREIEILRRIKHENICELKEAVVRDDCADLDAYLVLEFVPGGDLYGYLLGREPLGEVDAQHFTFQICEALAYIHSQNITHRDLKPENILLTKDNPPKVKVADFGLAKFVDHRTMLKTLCGTEYYLAPEVVNQENDEGYHNVVDSWSVGVIVFSMLTKANPYVEDPNQPPRIRIRERTIKWARLERCDVSPEAINFTRWLLLVDPTRRMTPREALEHLWLASHIPVYGRNTTFDDVPASDYANTSPGPGHEGPSDGSLNTHNEPSVYPTISNVSPALLGPSPNGL
ncbi:hypothetical protein DXG01_000885 [Tephrocybe rancida]|nr:hypothetical protein DXG01_000885 [Tephrocybe rancida]